MIDNRIVLISSSDVYLNNPLNIPLHALSIIVLSILSITFFNKISIFGLDASFIFGYKLLLNEFNINSFQLLSSFLHNSKNSSFIDDKCFS